MNIYLKLTYTGLLMVNTIIYVLFLEKYIGSTYAISLHFICSLIVYFMFKKLEHYDRKILEENEDTDN